MKLVTLIAVVEIVVNVEAESRWSLTYKHTHVPLADMTTMISDHEGIAYDFQSKFNCGVKAKENSKSLMCIHQDQCIIANYESNPMNTVHGITDPVSCWTIQPITYCMTDKGDKLSIGRSYVCEVSCQAGEDIFALARPKAPFTCDPPFSVYPEVNSACLAVINAQKSWCDARKHCLSLGSNLALFDRDVAFNARLVAKDVLGAGKVGSLWSDEVVGANDVTYSKQEDIPNSSVPPATCKILYQNATLIPNDCTEKLKFICMK